MPIRPRTSERLRQRSTNTASDDGRRGGRRYEAICEVCALTGHEKGQQGTWLRVRADNDAPIAWRNEYMGDTVRSRADLQEIRMPRRNERDYPQRGTSRFLVNSIQWVGSTRPVTCRASRLAGNSATAVDRWRLVGVAVI